MRVGVIGAGLAGLTASIRLLEAGHQVTMISAGMGGLPLSQGTFDVLGYAPNRLTRPFDGFGSLPEHHPYRLFTPEQVQEAVAWIGALAGLSGNLDENVWFPTAIGAVRPTALAPASFLDADLRSGGTFAVVGVRQLKDFHADLIAGNLARADVGGAQVKASASWIDFEPRRQEPDPSPVHFAAALDDPRKLEKFAAKVRGAARGDVILMPAVLGLRNPDVWSRVVELLGRPVAEVAMTPPSVPGLRIQQRLLEKARSLGLRQIQGAFVEGYEGADRIERLVIRAAGRDRLFRVDAVVHAPGGFESGGLTVDSRGNITERVFGLPVSEQSTIGLTAPAPRSPHPLFAVGVRADASMRPMNAAGEPMFSNLRIAGGLLAGAQRMVEKSGDGIAIASAVRAADRIEVE